MLRKSFFLSGCLVFLLLTACGFHVRSQKDMPPELKTIYIENLHPHSSLTPILSQALRGLNVNVVKTSQDAPVILEILDEKFSTSKVMLGTAQQVNTVTMNYTVSFMLKRKGQEVLNAPVVLTTSTSYLQNANQILGDTSMLPTYQQSLIRQMADQILSHLSAETTRHALSD